MKHPAALRAGDTASVASGCAWGAALPHVLLARATRLAALLSFTAAISTGAHGGVFRGVYGELDVAVKVFASTPAGADAAAREGRAVSAGQVPAGCCRSCTVQPARRSSRA